MPRKLPKVTNDESTFTTNPLVDAKLLKSNFLYELCEMWIASYTIEGLSQAETDYILSRLFNAGIVAGTRKNGGLLGDEELGFAAPEVMSWDYLNLPLQYRLIPLKETNPRVFPLNMIYNPKTAPYMYILPTKRPLAFLVEDIANDYVNAASTMIVNLVTNKLPFMKRIKGDKNGTKIKRLINSIINNSLSVFFADDEEDGGDIYPKATGVTQQYTALNDLKNAFKNDALTRLGIDNNNVMKKERAIVDEINANNAEINLWRSGYTNRISGWLNELNNAFGTKYTLIDNINQVVSVHEEQPQQQPQPQEDEQNGND